jgi:hypothetical protein
MTTAGRRPFSTREIWDDNSVGAGDWLGLAESLGESTEELEAAIARNANAAVRRTRVLVVVDLIFDLMGANRTTFECETILLVGLAQGKKAEESLVTCGRNR